MRNLIHNQHSPEQMLQHNFSWPFSFALSFLIHFHFLFSLCLCVCVYFVLCHFIAVKRYNLLWLCESYASIKDSLILSLRFRLGFGFSFIFSSRFPFASDLNIHILSFFHFFSFSLLANGFCVRHWQHFCFLRAEQNWLIRILDPISFCVVRQKNPFQKETQNTRQTHTHTHTLKTSCSIIS